MGSRLDCRRILECGRRIRRGEEIVIVPPFGPKIEEIVVDYRMFITPAII